MPASCQRRTHVASASGSQSASSAEPPVVDVFVRHRDAQEWARVVSAQRFLSSARVVESTVCRQGDKGV